VGLWQTNRSRNVWYDVVQQEKGVVWNEFSTHFATLSNPC
jgi:hypothetical protein